MNRVLTVKSVSIPRTSKSESTQSNGELRPPVSYDVCLNALKSSPYHQAAVISKAESSVGIGYELYTTDNVLSAELKKEWENIWPEGFQRSIDRIAMDFETFGNAFFEVRGDGSLFKASALYHVPARTVTAVRTKGGIVYKQRINGAAITFPVSDGSNSGLFHIKQYSPAAGFFGEPDWVAALKPVSLDASATAYNDNFFRNNCMPQWAIVLEDTAMDENTEQEIRNFFQAEFTGKDNSHKTLLLSGGGKVDFVRLQTESKDMSFMQLKNICRDEIAAAHNIPPRLMGIVAQGSLGGTGEMQWQLRYFENGKLKRRRNMYQEVFNHVLNGRGSIEFMGLDLSLEQDDADYYAKLVTENILTPQEAKQELGYENAEKQFNKK